VPPGFGLSFRPNPVTRTPKNLREWWVLVAFGGFPQFSMVFGGSCRVFNGFCLYFNGFGGVLNGFDMVLMVFFFGGF